MQALIDFDGWKTWCENPSGQVGSDKAGATGKAKINRLALPTPGTGGGSKKSPGAGGNKKSPGA